VFFFQQSLLESIKKLENIFKVLYKYYYTYIWKQASSSRVWKSAKLISLWVKVGRAFEFLKIFSKNSQVLGNFSKWLIMVLNFPRVAEWDFNIFSISPTLENSTFE